MKTSGEDWDAPLLITGCPRTGSSALARLLSMHDRICLFNEYSLYTSPTMEDSVWHRLQSMPDNNHPPPNIAPDVASLKARMATELPTPVSDGAMKSWLFGLLETPIQIYGDKMPYRYLEIMEEVVEAFPRSRFLVTIRDGRAVVASQIRRHRIAIESGTTPARWMQPTVELAESRWLSFARRWLELRKDPPAPCLEVRFEEATRSPEALVRRICEFVGMDYRREEFDLFFEAYRPIRVDTWREELPDIDDRLSDEFRDALGELGYA